jgi:hypothetical protein
MRSFTSLSVVTLPRLDVLGSLTLGAPPSVKTSVVIRSLEAAISPAASR